MSGTSPSERPDLHSAAYFGDQRDFWWNPDFVALLAQRVGLSKVRRALDVGCGVGHWGRVLLPHMPTATLVGVDREETWAREADKRAAAAGLSGRASYRAGSVEALPFPDETFDLVTCQTVLIHVADVPKALAEMKRVLSRGGLLLLAEPTNLASALADGSVRRAMAVDDRIGLVRFQMICERGKIALGEGDNSLGDALVGLVAAAGLSQVRCWISDRAQMLLPPYASPDQAAARDDMIAQHESGMWIWSRADTERYYLAGGGAAERFEAEWERARAVQRAEVDALRSGVFSSSGGGVHHVVAATKT